MIVLILTLMSSSMISIAQAEKKILINLASRALSLYDGNNRIGLYPLGVGKVSTPTPVGYYKILTKEIDPPWIDPSNPEYEVPSGANNPLGYRWMQIHGNYGIHGTNRPDSIGHYVSNGCIRMREADVEALFDKVEVGTPVEITYNRVVVEKAADDRIAYYIYPDGYNRQAIDVKYVNSWLAPWGISAFAEDSEISEAISKSNGEPVYIGKPYNVQIEEKLVPATDQNNRHFDSKAIEREGIVYLPAVPIAIEMKIKLEWKHHTTLATKYGEVPGIEKKGQLYINEDDAPILFKVEGWKEGNVYNLKPIVTEDETFGTDVPEKIQNVDENPNENPENKVQDIDKQDNQEELNNENTQNELNKQDEQNKQDKNKKDNKKSKNKKDSKVEKNNVEENPQIIDKSQETVDDKGEK